MDFPTVLMTDGKCRFQVGPRCDQTDPLDRIIDNLIKFDERILRYRRADFSVKEGLVIFQVK